MSDRAPALERTLAAGVPPHRTSLRAIFPTVAAASLGFAIVQLDVTAVNVAIPSLGHSFGSSVHGLQWIVDAYTLSFAALLLTSGTLADRFGSRRLVRVRPRAVPAGIARLRARAVAGRADRRARRAGRGRRDDPADVARAHHARVRQRRRRPCAGGRVVERDGRRDQRGRADARRPADRSLGWRAIFFINLPICAAGLWLTLRHVRDSAAARTRPIRRPDRRGARARAADGRHHSPARRGRRSVCGRCAGRVGRARRAVRRDRAARGRADAAARILPDRARAGRTRDRRGHECRVLRADLLAEPLFPERARLHRDRVGKPRSHRSRSSCSPTSRARVSPSAMASVRPSSSASPCRSRATYGCGRRSARTRRMRCWRSASRRWRSAAGSRFPR